MDKSGQKSQNIVAMSEYQPQNGFAAIAQVEAYWNALRGPRSVPRRSDIDPRGIERALGHAFITERVARGMVRIRIAGNHLTDLMGMEVRGMPLSALFEPDVRTDVGRLIEKVFQTPATTHLDLTARGGPARPEGQARMVMLPLQSEGGAVDRALGCLVYTGQIGIAPRRFIIDQQALRPLEVDRAPALPAPPTLSEPMPPLTAIPLEPIPGLAEPKTDFDGKRASDKRPPYLRLVQSDE